MSTHRTFIGWMLLTHLRFCSTQGITFYLLKLNWVFEWHGMKVLIIQRNYLINFSQIWYNYWFDVQMFDYIIYVCLNLPVCQTTLAN